jgi:hypothetical protein
VKKSSGYDGDIFLHNNKQASKPLNLLKNPVQVHVEAGRV